MLRQQLQNIQHQSALHVLCKAKQKKKIHLPFPGVETSIRELKTQHKPGSNTHEQDRDDGIYPGDTMGLYGKSGTGKTYILTRILNDAISQQLNVVYIDLEHQYGSTVASSAATVTTTATATAAAMAGSTNRNKHVHLFRPRTDGDLLGLIYSLEKWFYDRSDDIHVTWVMIDGEWILGDQHHGRQGQGSKRKLIGKLKQLQYHWPFALIYTYRGNEMTDGAQKTFHGQEYRFECYKQDQAICMKLVPPSSSNHAYSVDDLKSMVTIID